MKAKPDTQSDESIYIYGYLYLKGIRPVAVSVRLKFGKFVFVSMRSKKDHVQIIPCTWNMYEIDYVSIECIETLYVS